MLTVGQFVGTVLSAARTMSKGEAAVPQIEVKVLLADGLGTCTHYYYSQASASRKLVGAEKAKADAEVRAATLEQLADLGCTPQTLPKLVSKRVITSLKEQLDAKKIPQIRCTWLSPVERAEDKAAIDAWGTDAPAETTPTERSPAEDVKPAPKPVTAQKKAEVVE